MFALPVVLKENPRLLAYYRVLLGMSRKEFYTKKTGLGFASFRNMEDKGSLNHEAEEALPELCNALNQSLESLLDGLSDSELTSDHFHALSLMTLGAQLRGSHNFSIGTDAVKQVYEVIKAMVEPYATKITDEIILFTEATGREIEIRFGQDPDIEFITKGSAPHGDAPLLANEVKGGRDRSNVHNRLGEAEKSHLKAR